MLSLTDYARSTRHPWPILLFLLPLLLAYEIGVLALGGPQPQALRNGADAWLRWGLESFGFNQLIVAPGLVGVFFFLWSLWRREDRPQQLGSVCLGMILECFLFAIGLWAISHGFHPLLESLGVPLSSGPKVDPIVGRIITYVGAGIYEEILFRLILFWGLANLLRLALVPKPMAIAAAALISALAFAAAHHVGPYGERMNTYVFMFRAMAGVYFALLFETRGFAVAAGTHACYDVLVGLATP